jgi:hypothetical protein
MGDPFENHVAAFQEIAGRVNAGTFHGVGGRHLGFLHEHAREVSGAHSSDVSQPLDGESFGYVLHYMGLDLGHGGCRVTKRVQIGTELRLATLAPGKDHKPFCDLERDVLAMIFRHQGKRQVDAGRQLRHQEVPHTPARRHHCRLSRAVHIFVCSRPTIPVAPGRSVCSEAEVHLQKESCRSVPWHH